MKNIIPALALTVGLFTSTQLQAQQTNWKFTPPINNNPPIVQWTVPQTGLYTITAYGAQGGGVNSDTPYVIIGGGLGAIISGNLQLTEGQILNILAGGPGTPTPSGYPYGGGGGGGGSFVVDNDNDTPLVVAGGGGGVSGGSTGASNASTNTSGNNATGTDKSNQEGAGGTDGDGGSIGSDSSQTGGGGGGGFYTSGGSHYANNNYNVWGIEGGYTIKKGGLMAPGGNSYLSGGASTQANPGNTWHPSCMGGSGGGGNGIYGGYNSSGPGGGGGYSGGGGGGSSSPAKGQTYAGGGGGSYITPSATSVSMSVGNYDDGKVTISLVQLNLGNSLSFQPSRYLTYSPSERFTLTATSLSGAPITFTSGDPRVISVNGDTATIIGAGLTTLTASVPASGNYGSATFSAYVLVYPSSPAVDFPAPLSPISYKKGRTVPLAARSDSNGKIYFKSSNNSVISIVGNRATVMRRGTVTITAIVAATANYTGGTATQSVTVR